MNPLVVVLFGAGAVATLKHLSKPRTSAVSFQSGSTPTPIAIPSGWRRAKSEEVMPDALGFARAALQTKGNPGNLQLGAFSDGRALAALTEWHYHEPGGAARPWGWHHGITLLVQK